MARSIILCLDGTNNTLGDHQTNVVRFFRGLKLTKTQIPYYAQGIGTIRSQDVTEPEPMNERLTGMAFGRGLEDIVLDAYRFLCRTYDFEALKDSRRSGADPGIEPDKIYMFGFSRGAYAARMLAGFINEFGLLHTNSLHMAVHAFREYLALVDVDDGTPANQKYLALRRFENTFDPAHPPIEGLILFDTVASMIRLKGVADNLRTHRSPVQIANHPSTVSNPSVRFVIHALAVDEKRTFFRPLLWTDGQDFYGNRFKSGTPEPQIVHQVWFPGCHGDIGGSAREDEAGLGKLTASWVYDQLEVLAPQFEYRNGFHLRYIRGASTSVTHTEDGRGISKPDFDARIHESLKGAWQFAEWIPKTKKRREPPEEKLGWWPYYFPSGERRYIAPGSVVHPSVFHRRKHGSRSYDPPALKTMEPSDFAPADHPALLNPSYAGPA